MSSWLSAVSVQYFPVSLKLGPPGADCLYRSLSLENLILLRPPVVVPAPSEAYASAMNAGARDTTSLSLVKESFTLVKTLAIPGSKADAAEFRSRLVNTSETSAVAAEQWLMN